MDVVQRTKPAGALAVWGVVGVLWTVALLGILSLGVFIAPVAIIAAAVASHFYGKTGFLALPVAAAVTAVALLVPFLASGESESGGSSVPPPSIQR
jgi:heme/copper-type cytochrome/quinol oxidase subunit 1